LSQRNKTDKIFNTDLFRFWEIEKKTDPLN